MIHGAFMFIKSTSRMEYFAGAVVSITPWMRNAGFAPLSTRQVTERVYGLITGNEMAVGPYYVGTPGVRPMTACCEPWLHASGGEAEMAADPFPMYRERLVYIDVRFGDDGVAKGEASTVALSPTVDFARYKNNVGLYPTYSSQGGMTPQA
jgi:hypothetical protein